MLNKKPRLLYIITRLDGGGAQKSVLSSVLALQKENEFEVHLAFGGGGILDPYAKRNVDNFCVLKKLRPQVCVRNLWSDFLAFVELAHLIHEVKPDIVHTNCPKAGIIGRWAACFSLRRLKVVHTYHGLGFSVYDGFKYKIFAFLERVSGYITNKLIFVSLSNLGEAHGLKIGSYKKNILIHAGIDKLKLPKNFDKEKKKFALKIPQGKKVVLGIGNFKPLKNAADFARVAGAVCTQTHDFHFIYAGAGGESEEAVKTLAGQSVTFLGFREDIEELIAVSDIYCTTSLREGLAMAVLEALRQGVAVFAYDIDSMGEVIQNTKNGMLFKTGDIEGMAGQMLAFDKNKFERIFDEKEFSAAFTVEEQKKLYKTFISPKP